MLISFLNQIFCCFLQHASTANDTSVLFSRDDGASLVSTDRDIEEILENTIVKPDVLEVAIPQTNSCPREAIPTINTNLLNGIPQYSDQDATRCKGCGQAFSLNLNSLVRQSQSVSHLCYSCIRLLDVIKQQDIIGRLSRFTKSDAINVEHEAKFTYYLHQHKVHSHAELAAGLLYHLPLSTNYYRKQMGGTTRLAKFVYYRSLPEENNVSHFIDCVGCQNFVATRRSTLISNTKYAWSRYRVYIPPHIASHKELFALMVSSNCTCKLSGVQGVWITTPGYPDYSLSLLSLDHIVPLSKGGSSLVNNLQVSLQFFNNFKGSHSHEEFQTWLNGFKQKQGWC